LSELIVREALGTRRFAATDFPLAFGGEGSVVVLAGSDVGVDAYVGLHEDQLFVQPAAQRRVLHNGVPVSASTWLKPGDVLNVGKARLLLAREQDVPAITVEDGSAGNITAPPVITQDARIRGLDDGVAEPIAAIRFRPGLPAAASRRRTLKPSTILLGAVASAVLAVLWFIFTAISIGITTNPTTARVDIDGALPAVAVGGRYLVRPGNYVVHAAHAGYTSARSDIKVSAEPNQNFTLQLQKLPGILRIAVAEKAQVSIDGEPAGEAPMDFKLAPGKHTVALSSARYQLFTGSVEVAGAGKLQTWTPALVPNWGKLTVTSEPAGAQLLVDGEVRGVTPITAEVIAGNRPVELRLSGFKPWTTDVQVKANEAATIGPVTLGLPDSRLSVRSEPAGANVSVSGVYRGQTPLDIELRPEISHSLVLTKPGYEPATREIRLAAGESRTQSLQLTGVFGEIAIRAQPADAQLFVDGQLHGAPNQTLRLVATTHAIEIRKPGFVDFKANVTPRPGLPQVVETTLLTAEQTRVAATPATVRTKSGQTLKLMPLGRFTMGSPRREPGRRANEAQRDVEFRRAFYVAVNEVTNADFRRFSAAHRSGISGSSSLDLENQPAVNISWQQAAAYCNWLSEQEGLPPAYKKEGDSYVPVTPMTRGFRLLSDAEWEWVARYASNGASRRYPWGDTLPVAPASGNYADKSANIQIQDVVPNYDDGYVATAPVGKFPANALGLNDIGGNVAEWAHDYYTVSVEAGQVAVDSLGPAQGKQHVIRGSSWKQSSVTDLRLSARDFGDSVRNDVGLRVARYVE
jgi:formylglycine-generating enzyme required for sulfatase activity